jgi:hypothetical protein
MDRWRRPHANVGEPLKAGDALCFGLEQEPLSNIAAEPLLFSASLRSIRPTVNQTDAEHRAAAFQRSVSKRGSVVHIMPTSA